MKDSKQMELIPSTSLQEDTLANLSPSQVEKKVKKIRDTSGQSILDLSKNSDRLGLLEKMLVDTLNSVSTPLSRTWRVKTTPLGRLVFQLRASVPTTKEKESGLWLTPSATTISTRSKESMEKRKKYRESIGRTTVPPGNLAEQVQHGHKATHMWRTPDAHSGRGPSSEERMKMKLEKKMPISLNDQVAHPKLMWPTPTTRDYKDSGKAVINSHRDSILPVRVAKKDKEQWVKGGGSLNPTWVEWLMGYPSGWTDLNPSETVSSPKSPTTSDQSSLKRWPTPTSTDGQRGDVNNLDGYRRRRDKWAAKGVNIHKPLDVAVALEEEEKKQPTMWRTPTQQDSRIGPNNKGGYQHRKKRGSTALADQVMFENYEEKKIWRTPTAIDGGDKAEKYAARILLGKNKRSSKHKVQETLSMQVAMEELKDNPQRVEELMKEEMVTRPQLPEQKEFVEYMHLQTTPRKLSDQSGIDYTTVEHWFRRGGSFSYPSIKDWNHIKQFLQEVKFDKEMTTTETIEWKN